MTINEFINELAKLNINLSEKQLTQFQIYADFLLDYNSHTNLTRITEISQIYLKHFYDSLTIVQSIDFNSIANILDIGSGAGFPGMVLKIVFPHLKVILLDSNNKKTRFLQELITKLGVENIKVINSRAEEYAHHHLEEYDLVTSRAVANLITLSELSLPQVKINGYFIAMKGDLSKEEDYHYAITTLGGKITELKEFYLPYENSLRNIIKIQKITSSNSIYPRSYDKILKKPLKKIVK